MADIFPAATDARTLSRNHILIHDEVRGMEDMILQAINSGQLSITISGGTTMTDAFTGQPYYLVWNGTTTDRVLLDQMNIVSTYFSNLGYSIVRLTNPTTTNTFLWEIQW